MFGSGDCVTPEQIVARLASGVDGVLVGRGVLRNPWILAQAADLLAGRPAREVTLAERGQFLLDYIELLMHERVRDQEMVRDHEVVPTFRSALTPEPECSSGEARRSASREGGQKSHDRWVVNKLRALGAYYSKGIENGAEFRSGLNTVPSLDALRDLIARFFFVQPHP